MTGPLTCARGGPREVARGQSRHRLPSAPPRCSHVLRCKPALLVRDLARLALKLRKVQFGGGHLEREAVAQDRAHLLRGRAGCIHRTHTARRGKAQPVECLWAAGIAHLELVRVACHKRDDARSLDPLRCGHRRCCCCHGECDRLPGPARAALPRARIVGRRLCSQQPSTPPPPGTSSRQIAPRPQSPVPQPPSGAWRPSCERGASGGGNDRSPERERAGGTDGLPAPAVALCGQRAEQAMGVARSAMGLHGRPPFQLFREPGSPSAERVLATRRCSGTSTCPLEAASAGGTSQVVRSAVSCARAVLAALRPAARAPVAARPRGAGRRGRAAARH